MFILRIVSTFIPIFTVLIGLTLAIWVTGCSDSGSDLDGIDTDTDAPVVTKVTAIDNYHLEIIFNENVDKITSERGQNYTIIKHNPAPPLSPVKDQPDSRPSLGTTSAGDTLGITSVTLQQNQKTVVVSCWDQMEEVAYDIQVTGVRDLYGNGITQTQNVSFTGTTAPDQTPPEIILRSPMSGDTGVGLSQSVEVQFSEGMDGYSVYRAFYWTEPGGNVGFSISGRNNNTFIFSPSASLELNTQYTVGFTASVATDWASNFLAATGWTFRTTSVTDLIPPTIVSLSPADGETTVPLNANLIITFSEAIDPNSMTESIIMTPDPGQGIPLWQNGNTRLTFNPDAPLLAGTAYAIIIPPGSVKDLAGNPLSGGATASFTTGSALPSGAFTGIVTGDPSSIRASDPAGAWLIAFMIGIDELSELEGSPPAGGSSTVGAMGIYTVSNLPDDVYYPFAILDSNVDGIVEPMMGDAVGVLGVDYASGDLDYDSITVAGGNTITDCDFPLYDFVAIMGTVNYEGTVHILTLPGYRYTVGAFDTATFDTAGGLPVPDFFNEGDWFIQNPDYALSEFEDSLQPGTYFIGAYLDTDDNGKYDESIDLITFYADGANLLPVTVTGGNDQFDIDMVFEDPVIRSPYPAVRWPAGRPAMSPEKARLKRFLERALGGLDIAR
jgi:hypothetical protein